MVDFGMALKLKRAQDEIAKLEAELVEVLTGIVLAGGCSCNDGVTCSTCAARRRLPQLYDCASDEYPEIRALATTDKR